MNIKKLIMTLIDIEINTDDILELRDNPRKHVAKKEDVEKLEDLFLLIDLTDKLEVN
jgi:hypothetical protein